VSEGEGRRIRRSPACCFNPNPTRKRGILSDSTSLAYGVVDLILTRRVSEGFCRILRPSLTRRVVIRTRPDDHQREGKVTIVDRLLSRRTVGALEKSYT
jgi:hypothetical protein